MSETSEMQKRVAKAIGDVFAAEHDRLINEIMKPGELKITATADEIMALCARAAIEAIEAGLRELLKGEFSSLTIGFNDGPATNYCSVAKWYEEGGELAAASDYVSEKEHAAAMANNSEWSIQWYPDTPVGFYNVKASSLAAALDAALQEKPNE